MWGLKMKNPEKNTSQRMLPQKIVPEKKRKQPKTFFFSGKKYKKTKKP